MFVPVACSQCGKPFQVPEAAIGKPTSCPWCQGTVLALPVGGPPPASAGPDPADARTAALAVAEIEREVAGLSAEKPATEILSLDDEPVTGGSVSHTTQSAHQASTVALRASPSPSWRKRVLFAALVSLLAIATTALTLAILRYKQGYAVDSEWKTFTPPDGSCSIDLLGAPQEDDAGLELGERRYYSEGWYSGDRAWLGWKTLSSAEAQEASADQGWVRLRERIFDGERDRLKAKLGGNVTRDATISYAPLTVEVRIEGPQGPAIERMVVAGAGPHPRVYFLGITGNRLDRDGPLVRHFFESFHVNE